jgi:spore coat protein U-like protein
METRQMKTGRIGRAISLAAMVLVVLAVALPPVAAEAASSTTLSVTATVLSKSICKFRTVPLPLAFGPIDPGGSGDVTATTSIVIRCQGSLAIATFSITDDDGLHETGLDQNRMQHTVDPAAYLPYTLDVSPSSGPVAKNVDLTVTITGTVAETGYRDAPVGDYADTVVLTLLP